VAGKYKIASGNNNCDECLSGKYSETTGNIIDNCLDCPIYSTGPKASNNAVNCKCVSGAYKADGVDFCALCIPGKFKNDAGNHLCSSCPSAFLPDTGATSDDVCLYQYATTVSFSINGDLQLLSTIIINQIKSEVSLDLGVDISRITQVDFRKSPATARRLLTIVLFFSIISDSEIEADQIESLIDIAWLDKILAVSSQNTITASSFELQRKQTTFAINPYIPLLETVGIYPKNLTDTSSNDGQIPVYVWIIIAVGVSVLLVMAAWFIKRHVDIGPQKTNNNGSRPVVQGGFNITSGNLDCKYCNINSYLMHNNFEYFGEYGPENRAGDFGTTW